MQTIKKKEAVGNLCEWEALAVILRDSCETDFADAQTVRCFSRATQCRGEQGCSFPLLLLAETQYRLGAPCSSVCGKQAVTHCSDTKKRPIVMCQWKIKIKKSLWGSSRRWRKGQMGEWEVAGFHQKGIKSSRSRLQEPWRPWGPSLGGQWPKTVLPVIYLLVASFSLKNTPPATGPCQLEGSTCSRTFHWWQTEAPSEGKRLTDQLICAN